MNKYDKLIYSLIYNCNREVTTEEKKILNQASAIYNTYNDLTKELGYPLEVIAKLLQFSRQRTVYTIYGTHTDEIVIVDLNLGRLHISINGDINDSYCLYIKDYKKTWWLKADRSE